MAAPVRPAGGVGGIDAHCHDILATAAVFGRAASDCVQDTLALGTHLAGPTLAASALLDPVGSLEAEGALTTATARLGALAVRCGGLDVALRAAASAYATADVLGGAEVSYLRPALLVPAAVAGGLGATLRTADPRAGLQRALTGDPGIADLLARLLPGQVGGVTGLLSAAYPDGAPAVRLLGTSEPAPPRTVRGLMTGLAARNDGLPGEIDVHILTAPDGRRHAVVDIPGTKDWSLALHQSDVTSLATNLRALSGHQTTYEAGVLAAMQAAGVRSDDDVLLVGHSEGGMVALNAADHARGMHISHVITAGAPIGLTAGSVPSQVDVLALENAGDLVPHLDGAANPDRPNVLTVRTAHDTGTILGNHDLWQSYVPGAADVDASEDPSVRAYVDGLDPFLRAAHDETYRYVITRTYW